MTGRIFTMQRQRGFAFITPDDCMPNDGHDHFAHREDVRDFDTLRIGQAVEFESTVGPRGLRAVKVRTLPKPTRTA